MSELDKLSAASEVRGHLIEFLDWIGSHPGLSLGEWTDFNSRGGPRKESKLVPTSRTRTSIIYEYLDIDAKKLEDERRSLLDGLRAP